MHAASRENTGCTAMAAASSSTPTGDLSSRDAGKPTAITCTGRSRTTTRGRFSSTTGSRWREPEVPETKRWFIAGAFVLALNFAVVLVFLGLPSPTDVVFGVLIAAPLVWAVNRVSRWRESRSHAS